MATYKTIQNQNLFDVALHLYGSIEGLFDLLISNPEINMSTDLKYGQELEYHEDFEINSEIVEEFASQNIIPSSGCRHVYFKRPQEDLLFIVGVNNTQELVFINASGEGTLLVDWGDNSEIEQIDLSVSGKLIEHYFDNEVEKRRIKFYGNRETLSFMRLDTTGLKGALVLCCPLIVDEFTCKNCIYALTGLKLMQGTYKVNLQESIIADLTPIADMSLQELDLRGVHYVHDDVLDNYLSYVVNNYNDRRPCVVHLSSEPGEKGYEAINTILNEPEWNASGEWKFYINNQLYQSSDGTNPE